MTSIRKIITIFALGMFSLSAFAMEFKVFNVGQGNCTVITKPDEPTVVLDGGSSHFPLNRKQDKIIITQIASYIIKNTKQKSVIVASHPDKDHINWLPKIVKKLKDFKVTTILGGIEEDYKPKLVKKKLKPTIQSTTYEALKKISKKVYFADDHKIFAELPSYCKILASNPTARDNDKSIIIRASDDRNSILITGDASAKIIKSLGSDCQSKYLILPHHGAFDHQDTAALLEKVNPDWVIISAGMMGNYKHPDSRVLKAVFDYFRKKGRLCSTRCHTLNYAQHCDEPLADPEGLRTIACFENSGKNQDYNFFSAISKCPVLELTNVGSIRCTDRKIFAEKEGDQITPINLTLNALNRTYFEKYQFKTIERIFFQDFGFTDENIIKAFKKLPPHLRHLSLHKNKLTFKSVTFLAEKLQGHKTPAVVIFKIPFSHEDSLDRVKEEEKEPNKKRLKKTLHSLKHLKNKNEFSTVALIERLNQR